MSALLSFLLNECDRFKRARLPSLYSDFAPQRFSNPDGFTANVAAWQEGLAMAARAGVLSANGGSTVDTLSLKTGEPLLQALETKEWGRPLALRSVIDESISRRQMIPLQEFIAAPRNIYTRDWKVQPWWFLSWAFKHLGVFGSSTSVGTLPTGRFVVMANVEQAGAKVLARMAVEVNEVNRIHPMRAFQEKVGSALGLKDRISERDLAILLTSLSRDMGAIVHNSEVVKFKALGDDSTTLSTEDKTIASLKVLISDLSGQVSVLSNEIRGLTATAREAVGRKDRTLATTALKSRKSKESMLARRTDALLRVEEVLHQIEQAHDQVAMIKVMKASTSVLRNLRIQTGEVEKAEQIVEDLRDEMQQVDEMGNAIEAGGQSNAVDEDVVDAELEQMIQQANIKEEEKEAQAMERRLADIEDTKAEMSPPTPIGQNAIGAGDLALERLSLNEDPVRSDQPETASGA